MMQLVISEITGPGLSASCQACRTSGTAAAHSSAVIITRLYSSAQLAANRRLRGLALPPTIRLGVESGLGWASPLSS
jgi:hypothetical protein